VKSYYTLLVGAALLGMFFLVEPHGRFPNLVAAVSSIDFSALKRWQLQGIFDANYFSQLCPKPTTHYRDRALDAVTRDMALPADYVPTNLVNITPMVRTIGIQCLDLPAALAIKDLFAAARRDGVELAVTSGFRRPEIQQITLDTWISIEGPRARNEVAEPFHSEHQLGTAVDLSGASQGFSGVQDNFGTTKEGKWLALNAPNYGFTLSYPSSSPEYVYEPWHFRYVGTSTALFLLGRGVTFNEYFSGVSTIATERMLYSTGHVF
jgi:D-alanyl-D-alanine carboxypeptidase